MPLFAKELRDAAVVGLEELKKKNEENETETPKEAINELISGKDISTKDLNIKLWSEMLKLNYSNREDTE